MYDERINERAKANTSDLNEELGQVSAASIVITVVQGIWCSGKEFVCNVAPSCYYNDVVFSRSVMFVILLKQGWVQLNQNSAGPIPVLKQQLNCVIRVLAHPNNDAAYRRSILVALRLCCSAYARCLFEPFVKANDVEALSFFS